MQHPDDIATVGGAPGNTSAIDVLAGAFQTSQTCLMFAAEPFEPSFLGTIEE